MISPQRWLGQSSLTSEQTAIIPERVAAPMDKPDVKPLRAGAEESVIM